MSRRGGLQPKTAAMYQFLLGAADAWQRTEELTNLLSEEFGLSIDRAKKVVQSWSLDNPMAVQRVKVGNELFYCSRMQMKPDSKVIAARRWLALPEGFRQRHNRMRGLSRDDWEYAVLLAYGALVLHREDARRAFNEWAEANGHWLIAKK